jgi:phospholipase C
MVSGVFREARTLLEYLALSIARSAAAGGASLAEVAFPEALVRRILLPLLSLCATALATLMTLALAHGCGGSGNAEPVQDAGFGTDGGSGMEGGHGTEGGQDASVSDAPPSDAGQPDASTLAAARATIKHIVIINQENRSFDHYFGTFPGADGIPMDGGVPTVCNTDPHTGMCQAPYHDMNDKNYGGPHGHNAFTECVASGAMSGFIKSAENGTPCPDGSIDPQCTPADIDVMGYHTDGEIPNYWAYATNFVLQDHLFEPVSSYSLPDHLYMVSAWSATCTPPNDPTNCVSDLSNPGNGAGTDKADAADPEYAWTDITFLLNASKITWNYYVAPGLEPDCPAGLAFCDSGSQDYKTPGYWNVLPWFDDVKEDDQIVNVQDTSQFYDNVKANNLASVSWLIPNSDESEHPTALVSRGQAYVTQIINLIMQSPYWNSTVIFLTWDDWGGFYDHMNPLTEMVDANGYGIRVPAMTISPWVQKGLIDHQVLSHDAYLKFIEDIFLNSQRLNPATDGRNDNRPTVRETVPQLGDLLNEFDFTQTPLPPLVLDACPAGVDTIFNGGPCVQ